MSRENEYRKAAKKLGVSRPESFAAQGEEANHRDIIAKRREAIRQGKPIPR